MCPSGMCPDTIFFMVSLLLGLELEVVVRGARSMVRVRIRVKVMIAVGIRVGVGLCLGLVSWFVLGLRSVFG